MPVCKTLAEDLLSTLRLTDYMQDACKFWKLFEMRNISGSDTIFCQPHVYKYASAASLLHPACCQVSVDHYFVDEMAL